MTVKVVESATKDDVIEAFSDPESKIIVTSGHGYDPKDAIGIQTSDGKLFSPDDVKKDTLSKDLKTVIFENCYQGDNREKWAEALGDNVNIVGWTGTTTVSETKRFNGSGFFDRQKGNLKSYVKDIVGEKKNDF
jgi:exopolysaccharide biosynthesis protein